MRSPLTDSYEGHSLALYSSWLVCRPFHFMVDCGEGCATALRNRVFGLRTVALTHGHLDHISGLPSLLNARHAGMGDVDAPLTIVYPAGDPLLAPMRSYLAASQPAMEDKVSWRAMEPGERVPLDDQRSLEAFATRHAAFLTLGYRLIEHRTRLRGEFHGLSGSAIRDLAAARGREAISEGYDHPLAVFGGDGLAPDPAMVAGADVAWLEATFLDEADRGPLVHATMAEAVAVAAQASVRDLVLTHVSGRYQRADAKALARRLAIEHGLAGRLHLMWREHIELLSEGVAAADA
ncbi:MAG: MBL fold metallo-hydrolase [Armatimonadetes bacterium]|nr:MBL fold metallo-hydrolase [Armatimonadota bacterium]